MKPPNPPSTSFFLSYAGKASMSDKAQYWDWYHPSRRKETGMATAPTP